MRISDWSSDVCSSDLCAGYFAIQPAPPVLHHALCIIGDIVRRIGLRAIGDDLHQRLRAARGQALLEILRYHHKAAQAARDDPFRDLAPVMSEGDVQIADRKSTRLNSSH